MDAVFHLGIPPSVQPDLLTDRQTAAAARRRGRGVAAGDGKSHIGENLCTLMGKMNENVFKKIQITSCDSEEGNVNKVASIDKTESFI